MAEIVCGNWRGSETEIYRVKDRDGSGCAQVVLPIVGVLLLAVGSFLPLELIARIGCGLLGFTLVVTAISARSLNTRWRVCLDREKGQMRFAWDSSEGEYCVPCAACRNIVLEKSFRAYRNTGDSAATTRVIWYFEFYLAQTDGSRFLIDHIMSHQADPAPDGTGPTAELLNSFTGLAVEDLSDNGLDFAATTQFDHYQAPEPTSPGQYVTDHSAGDESVLGIRQSKRLKHQLPAICVLMLLLLMIYWIAGEMALCSGAVFFLFAIPILLLMAVIGMMGFTMAREIRQKILLRSDEIVLEMSLGVTFLPDSVTVLPQNTRLSLAIATSDIAGIELHRGEKMVDLRVAEESSVRKALLEAPWYLVGLYGPFLSGLAERERSDNTGSKYVKLASIALTSSQRGPTINDLAYLQYRIKSHFGLREQFGPGSE